MIQMLEIYRRTGIPNIYREELWLIRFAESPYRDPLEALFENAPPFTAQEGARSGA